MSFKKPPSYLPRDLKLGNVPAGKDGEGYRRTAGADWDGDEEGLLAASAAGGAPALEGTIEKDIEGVQGVIVLLFWYINLIFSVLSGLCSIYIYYLARQAKGPTSLLYSVLTLVIFSFFSAISTLALLVSNHLALRNAVLYGTKQKQAGQLLIEHIGMGGIWLGFVGQVIATIGLMIELSGLASYTCVSVGGASICLFSTGMLAGLTITALIISFISAIFTINVFTLIARAIKSNNAKKRSTKEAVGRYPTAPQPFERFEEREESLYSEGGIGRSEEQETLRESRVSDLPPRL